MEQLYPQNILERHYPILREQRERKEREATVEEDLTLVDLYHPLQQSEGVLYENTPAESGAIGLQLNTIA